MQSMCLTIWVNVSCLRVCTVMEMESLTREDQYLFGKGLRQLVLQEYS